MAIVKMNKISLIGLESEKSHILKLLMKRGFVQIDDSSYLTDEGELSGIVEKDGDDSKVIELEQIIYSVEQAITTLSKNIQAKKGLFSPKKDFEGLTSKEVEKIYGYAKEINYLNQEFNTLKNEENTVISNKNLLLPWEKFDVPLKEMKTKKAKILLGTFLSSIDLGAVNSKLSNEAPESFVGSINADKQFSYVYLISHKETFDTAIDVLKEFSFTPVTFSDMTKTPSAEIKDFETRLIEISQKQQEITEKIKSFASSLSALENLYDYYCIERDRYKITSNIIKTKESFCINGWLPSEKSDSLVRELTEKFNCYIETEEGNSEEGYPVLLKNNSIVTPFEDITNMYSTPNTKDVDPTGIMTIFYIIFFGIMLGDAGYGLLIAAACFFVVKKAKMKKGEGNLIKLMGICGISTAIWGFLLGSFFGVATPGIINPLEDVMLLMAMSLVFGIIHIYIGLAIKGYMLLRDGDVVSFICDIVLWYIFITGVCIVIIPIVAGDIGSVVEVGKYLAIIGVVGIVLTGGRSYKGIFLKLFKGVSSLYGITGYFGDILSYTRLMALCLSSGVIAQVINLLGAMAGPVGIVLIGLIGHAVNLFIGALGAYVHTSRLQFVEFFGKFYEGGGKAFKPFKFNTKYTTINKEEM